MSTIVVAKRNLMEYLAVRFDRPLPATHRSSAERGNVLACLALA
jgi:hypothetical protein